MSPAPHAPLRERLSRSGRTVRTRVFLHERNETMWFWTAPASRLAIADYAGYADYKGDGRPDFNVGQYTNSTKSEYGLFTIHDDGTAERYSVHHPEIYVAPGGEPSTARIEAIPGGMRFRDFGNAGEVGWWELTCTWEGESRTFACSGKLAAEE